jgi:hypothetical protein
LRLLRFLAAIPSVPYCVAASDGEGFPVTRLANDQVEKVQIEAVPEFDVDLTTYLASAKA